MGRNSLAWQMGDLPVFCDNGASCNMSVSSTGLINYREASATMRTASGKRYPIEGYGDLPLAFDLAVVKCLCCSATLHMYPAPAIILFYFSESRSRRRAYVHRK